MALDRALADERGRDDGRVEVVAAAGRVAHADVGVGQCGANAGANVVRCHRRRQAKTLSARVYSTRGRFAPALYSTVAMTLGTRVTLVTTTVIASVLAGSGYAALKVRRANLEADLGREAFEIATALRAGIEPVTVKGDALSEMLHRRIRAAREPNELFQLEVLSGGTDEKTDDEAWLLLMQAAEIQAAPVGRLFDSATGSRWYAMAVPLYDASGLELP